MDAQQPNRRRGGQPGNTNALRTGKHSKQLRDLVELLISDPEARALVERFARLAQRPNGLADFRTAINRYGISAHGKVRRQARINALRREAARAFIALDFYQARRQKNLRGSNRKNTPHPDTETA
ncbi:MAG: hypothetical protein WEB04_08770 [Dehalococcoidia bacterium]